jgi:tetratricopeptide (TPR) repeat protein
MACNMDLAKRLYADGKYEEAEEVADSVVSRLRKVRSPSNPEFLEATRFLFQCLYVQWKYEEAERILRGVVATQKKELGLRHAETRRSAKDLACMLKDLGEYKKAHEIVLEVLSVEMKLLGEKHPNTVESVEWRDDLRYRLSRDDGQPARQHCSGAAPPSANKRKKCEKVQLEPGHEAPGVWVRHKKKK